MEFFLEMVLTAIVALLFSFVMAKLVSVATAGGGNGPNSDSKDKSGRIHVGEEVRFGQRMEARVLSSERNVEILEENVEYVDRFVSEAVRVDESEVAETGSGVIGGESGELAVGSSEADSSADVSTGNVLAEDMLVGGQEGREAESGTAVSPGNLIAEEIIVGGEEGGRTESMATVSPVNVEAEDVLVRGKEEHEAESSTVVSPKAEEMIGGAQEDQRTESAASVSPENVVAEEMGVGGGDERESERGVAVSPENLESEETMARGQGEGSESAEERSGDEKIEERGDAAVAEPEEIRVEECESKEGAQEKTVELNIEDDWEGIEKSELEKAFAAAAKFVEESVDGLEIGSDAKTELYGLHKIATEGPCRDSPPMALMVSARAKWNAWQKLGNMSQEEAMEQYLALLSREIPGQGQAGGSTVEKRPEVETSVIVSPDSGSLEQPRPLNTTESKHKPVEGDTNEASDLDNKFQAKMDSSI